MKDFNRATIKALKAKNAAIISTTWLAGPDGSFANGQTGYVIDDNGTCRIMDYLQVLRFAGTR